MTTDTRAYSRIRLAIDSFVPSEVAPVAAALLAPADLVVLIGRAMVSPDVEPKTKAYLVLAGLYCGAGLDLVPDALLGPIGYTDDGIVVLEALHRLLNDTDARVLEQLWSGDPRVLAHLQQWVGQAREGVHRYVVRPLAQWLRRVIGQAIAGRAAT